MDCASIRELDMILVDPRVSGVEAGPSDGDPVQGYSAREHRRRETREES